MDDNQLELATFGGGCFWCTEAVFQEVKGVEKVVSGYAGGTVPGTPTYREVCSGRTGHAEVIQVSFDPLLISFEELIIIFLTTHDPTQLNRQGADVGSQYRSVVFYHNEQQHETTRLVIKEISKHFPKPIVTEVSIIPEFFEAESDHQDYYKKHPEQGYCSMVINPKLQKFRKMYAEKLKIV